MDASATDRVVVDGALDDWGTATHIVRRTADAGSTSSDGGAELTANYPLSVIVDGSTKTKPDAPSAKVMCRTARL